MVALIFWAVAGLQKCGKKTQQFEKLLREWKQPPRSFSHTLNIELLIFWSESIRGWLLTLLKFIFVAGCTRRGSRRHSRCLLWAYWWWSSPPWGDCWGQWFLPGGLSFPLHGGETVIQKRVQSSTKLKESVERNMREAMLEGGKRNTRVERKNIESTRAPSCHQWAASANNRS